MFTGPWELRTLMLAGKKKIAKLVLRDGCLEHFFSPERGKNTKQISCNVYESFILPANCKIGIRLPMLCGWLDAVIEDCKPIVKSACHSCKLFRWFWTNGFQRATYYTTELLLYRRKAWFLSCTYIYMYAAYAAYGYLFILIYCIHEKNVINGNKRQTQLATYISVNADIVKTSIQSYQIRF